MLPNFQKFLKTLDDLNLDQNSYMITGSGSMAVRGLRDCADLDVLVPDSVGLKLKEKYPERFHEWPFCDDVQFEGVDIMWNIKEKDRPYSTEYQLEQADIVDGRKYQTLEMVKFFKKRMNREKDFCDIKLIEEYQSRS